jgi:hypothetical protein
MQISLFSQVVVARIKDFLSKFVGPASTDVTDGIADMDIGDQDDDPETQRMKSLKYMSQLVRVNYISLSPVRLKLKCSNVSQTVTNKCLSFT